MLLRAIPVSSDAYSFASIAVNLSAPCLLLHCPSGTVILRMVRMQPGRLVHLQCGHSLVLLWPLDGSASQVPSPTLWCKLSRPLKDLSSMALNNHEVQPCSRVI